MESLNNITNIFKEVMEKGIARDMHMHNQLMLTYRELQAEVAENERHMLTQCYLVRKVFLGDEINQRLATMRHVMDMLMAVDRAIMIQKMQGVVLARRSVRGLGWPGLWGPEKKLGVTVSVKFV